MKLLIADDYDDVRETYHMMLCKRVEGRNCTMACDGQEAIDKYEEARLVGCPFDLIILDVMMPKKNGFQVAEYIRERGDDKTQIVIVTGYPDHLTAPRAAYVHACEVWQKPIHPEEFTRRVAALLERKVVTAAA